MTQKEIIHVLNDLILQEEKILTSSIPADNYRKKAFLYSLLRTFDTYHFFTKENKKFVHHYDYGWLRALGLIYGDYVNGIRYPLFKMNEEMLSSAHWFIIRAGELGYCRSVVDHIKAGLGTAFITEKVITVEFKNIGIKEEFDFRLYQEAFNLVHNNFSEPRIKKIEKEIDKRIRKQMRSMVEKWKKYYIQYDTTSEIDKIFEKYAYYLLFAMGDKQDFNQDALFGGIPYSKYCEFVIVVCGIALKHFYFCLELHDKYKGEIAFPDIMTIPKDRKGFIESMSKYLEVSIAESEQMLDSITLNSENIEHHSKRLHALPPPYIKIADNSLVQSIAGSQIQPYNFLNHELRRKYKQDYFVAVTKREETFRNQLYELFQENNYIKINKNIFFKSSKGMSDTDAIIYDEKANVIGIFQLKWQERFGASMQERFSRISNLYPKTVTWIDKVGSWINESEGKSTMEKLGIYCNKYPVKVLLFVICRHGTFFTGYEPDKRAAWSSMWQTVRAFSQIPKQVPNKLEVLHNLLFQEYASLSKAKQGLEEESYKIGEYELRLKEMIN